MGLIRSMVTYECDRCARQQTIEFNTWDYGEWVIYRNEGTQGTITLCPSCASFFYDFMQGKEVKAI